MQTYFVLNIIAVIVIAIGIVLRVLFSKDKHAIGFVVGGTLLVTSVSGMIGLWIGFNV